MNASKGKSTIVFLGTYPPRECGIATFTQDLLSYAAKSPNNDVKCVVAAFNHSPLDSYKYPKEVVWEIDQNSKKEHRTLAANINVHPNTKGVIIQHEYGIFGGPQGENILEFMRNCTKPMLVTLHTVLPSPDEKMREVTAEIIKLASSIVVLTERSKELVEQTYPTSIGKVSVIPHGIHYVPFSTPKKKKGKKELDGRVILSTFGLLGPDKGVEYVIRGLPKVVRKFPLVRYLIIGATHPLIRRREGESYRNELQKLVTDLKLQRFVKFYDQYLDLDDLFDFLKATDIYVSTSTDPNQAVSGTLSYALGAGRPVVSTEFAQARELVSPEMGRLVPMKNSQAFAKALLDMLSDEEQLIKMSQVAYKNTRSMLWSNVSNEYIALVLGTKRQSLPPLKLDHLFNMTDNFGLFQFALYSTPNRAFGYTLDDNARALVLCSWLIASKQRIKGLQQLAAIYLSFIIRSQLEDGIIVNYLSSKNESPTIQNKKEDLRDAQYRAIWALAEVMQNEELPVAMRDMAKKAFLKSLKNSTQIDQIDHLRARAYAIKALILAQEALPEKRVEFTENITTHADSLVQSLKENSNKSWIWFEDRFTYNNGVLPESLLLAGAITGNKKYTEHALNALDFLISKTFSHDMYHPIGSTSFHGKNNKRTYFDQQPEEPASMIFALVEAYKTTDNIEYKNLAKTCFSWFLGNNSLNLSVYDEVTGGCYDGLHPDRMNLNQGAESLVSYLMARFVMSDIVSEVQEK